MTRVQLQTIVMNMWIIAAIMQTGATLVLFVTGALQAALLVWACIIETRERRTIRFGKKEPQK